MYECCYDYLKTNYEDNAKLCYMDTNCFIAHVKQKKFLYTLLKMHDKARHKTTFDT